MTQEDFEPQISISYRYTLGGQSKFFIDLMNDKKLQGTKCKECGKIWMPPWIACSDCFEDTLQFRLF